MACWSKAPPRPGRTVVEGVAAGMLRLIWCFAPGAVFLGGHRGPVGLRRMCGFRAGAPHSGRFAGLALRGADSHRATQWVGASLEDNSQRCMWHGGACRGNGPCAQAHGVLRACFVAHPLMAYSRVHRMVLVVHVLSGSSTSSRLRIFCLPARRRYRGTRQRGIRGYCTLAGESVCPSMP